MGLWCFGALSSTCLIIFGALGRLGDDDLTAQHRNDLNVTFAVGCISISFECNMDVMYKEYLYTQRAAWVICLRVVFY